MAEKTLRVRFLCGIKDADIALSAYYYRPKRVLIAGYNRYLNHGQGRLLPLPPPTDAEELPTVIDVRICEYDENGIYDFFQSIDKNNWAHVARALMRYAVDGPDFRHLTGNAPLPEAPAATEKRKQRRPKSKQPRPVPGTDNVPVVSPMSAGTANHESPADGDNIFDFI